MLQMLYLNLEQIKKLSPIKSYYFLNPTHFNSANPLNKILLAPMLAPMLAPIDVSSSGHLHSVFFYVFQHWKNSQNQTIWDTLRGGG